MKKYILAAVSAVTLVTIAAPAHAQSANDWIRYQQATDPAYNRDRWWGYSGGGYLPLIPYYPNAVKQNTARRGGEWFKNCGDDPAVPIHENCNSKAGNQSTQQNQQVATVSYTVDNGRLVAESNQAAQALPSVQQGYWEEDQDQKCYVVPSGERGVTRYCNKK
jgi:hypothetical protein